MCQRYPQKLVTASECPGDSQEKLTSTMVSFFFPFCLFLDFRILKAMELESQVKCFLKVFLKSL